MPLLWFCRSTYLALGETATLRISLPQLNEAGQLARRMVVHSPRPELKETLALELQVFGQQIIQQVKQFGVRVIILESHKALTDIRIQGMMMVHPSREDLRRASLGRGAWYLLQ